MRTHLLLALILAGATGTLPAQTGQTATSPGAKVAPSQPLILTGFSMRDTKDVTPPMFTDHMDGTKHRLSDWHLTKASSLFSMQAHSIVDTPRLKIAGGLTPSPNLAAQAGAIDPGQAAVVALGGGAGIWFGEP